MEDMLQIWILKGHLQALDSNITAEVVLTKAAPVLNPTDGGNNLVSPQKP